VEEFASRDLELGRHAAGVETWRYGGLEACSGPGDVEEFASRDLELGRLAAGVGTCRSLSQELWGSGGAQQACRRGGVCLFASRALEACCRCRDVEEA